MYSRSRPEVTADSALGVVNEGIVGVLNEA